jgi:hypothetical protein
MGKLLLGAAAVVASLSLTAGVAAAQTGNVNVAASGPGAHVGVDSHDENKAKVRNNTNAHVYNDTYQDADSGDAKTWHNTTGGSATSGAASNGNALSVSGSVNQSSGVGGMELGSGPSSHVHVNSHDKNSVSVKNNVNFKVSNDTTQKAETGDASVVGNTTGGNATSGAASNTNSSSVSLTVTQ